MKSKTKRRMFRQGDVLLIETLEARQSESEVHRANRILLAEGEATGHAHVLESEQEMEWWRSDGGTVIELSGPAKQRPPKVVHEEHGSIELAKSRKVRVVRQRQYSPEGIRNVAD